MSKCAGCGSELDSIVLVATEKGLLLGPGFTVTAKSVSNVATMSRSKAEKAGLKAICLNPTPSCLASLSSTQAIKSAA